MTTCETQADLWHLLPGRMPLGSICGPSRGRYGRLYRIDGTRGIRRWLDSNDNPRLPPRIVYCDHPKHSYWTKERRNRTRFLRADGYVQHWTLSKREFVAAMKAWDMMSLDLPSRLVCPNCAATERKAEPAEVATT